MSRLIALRVNPVVSRQEKRPVPLAPSKLALPETATTPLSPGEGQPLCVAGQR